MCSVVDFVVFFIFMLILESVAACRVYLLLPVYTVVEYKQMQSMKSIRSLDRRALYV